MEPNNDTANDQDHITAAITAITPITPSEKNTTPLGYAEMSPNERYIRFEEVISSHRFVIIYKYSHRLSSHFQY